MTVNRRLPVPDHLLSPTEKAQYGVPLSMDDCETIAEEIEAVRTHEDDEVEDRVANAYLEGKAIAVDDMVSGYLEVMYANPPLARPDFAWQPLKLVS